MDNYYAVIMAGGGGTRLWPLSRRERPKQLLRLVSERSMYQIAIDRLLRIFSTERILIVTIAAQVEALHAEFPSIPLENFIIEPMPIIHITLLAKTFLRTSVMLTFSSELPEPSPVSRSVKPA